MVCRDVGCVQEHTPGRLLWFVRMCIGKHRGHLECQETKAEYRAGKSKMTRYSQSHGRRGLEKRLVESPMCVGSIVSRVVPGGKKKQEDESARVRDLWSGARIEEIR